MARPIPKKTLARWQTLDAAFVLLAVAEYAKRDISYQPVKNSGSSRWHTTVGGTDFELVLTGPKFWDTRSRTGGGGAVDLIMHLTGLDFIATTKRLKVLSI